MGRRTCIAKDCNSDPGRPQDRGVSFHRVPKHPELRKLWYEACGAEDNFSSTQLVCSRHFYSADFAKYTGAKYVLKKKVVPSIFTWSKSAPTRSKVSKKDGNDAEVHVVASKECDDEEEDNDVEMKTKDDDDDSESDALNSPPTLEPEDLDTKLRPEADKIPDLEPSLEPSKMKMLPALHFKSMAFAEETSIIKSKIIVEEKCNPAEIKSHRDSQAERGGGGGESKVEEQSEAVSLKAEPVGNQPFAAEITITGGDLTFQPNTRVEALDNNQKWAPATILEVDYEENEVLVRFDTATSRYTEWIGINSSALRPLTPQVKENAVEESPTPVIAKKTAAYAVGDRCWAYWTNNRKFLATVTDVVENDNYMIEFDDGYVQIVHESRMFRPKTSMAKTTKEDRKKRKRKLNVEALFKRRTKPASTTVVPPSTQDTKPIEKVEQNETNRWYPMFENGVPVGKLSQIQCKYGPRDSYIVPDPHLPEGWEKHIYSTDSKSWNCLIITTDGKRLRYRREYERYTISNPDFKWQDYVVDFGVHPRRRPSHGIAHRKEIVPSTVDAVVDTSSLAKSDALKIMQVDGVFQCPIEGCGKNFRRENLVQMHVKHYHPEYRKFLESTPNVVDMAYKRLHADDFESSPTRPQVEDAKEFDPKKIEVPAQTDSASPMSTVSGQEFGRSEDFMLDLKSLAVTTKKGLKTIPAVKKPKKESSIESDVGVEQMNVNVEVEDETCAANESMTEEYEHGAAGIPRVDHYIGEDGKVIKIEHMRKEEIINCTCTLKEEDGLMIQCEVCMCWQHAACNNYIREEDVPEKYVCYICQHPWRQRSSQQYMHDQDWLKNGILPTGSYHARDDVANDKLFKELKMSHDLSGGLLEMKDYLHALKLKIRIAEEKNHPKLYLWAKAWDKLELPENRKTERKKMRRELVDVKMERDEDEEDEEGETMDVEEDDEDEDEESVERNDAPQAPQPEAPIETEDCRLNLLEHIANCHDLIGKRLDAFEQHIDALDHCDVGDEESDHRIRMTTCMMMRDLVILKELANYGTF